jgi:hypothetical protein
MCAKGSVSWECNLQSNIVTSIYILGHSGNVTSDHAILYLGRLVLIHTHVRWRANFTIYSGYGSLIWISSIQTYPVQDFFLLLSSWSFEPATFLKKNDFKCYLLSISNRIFPNIVSYLGAENITPQSCPRSVEKFLPGECTRSIKPSRGKILVFKSIWSGTCVNAFHTHHGI